MNSKFKSIRIDPDADKGLSQQLREQIAWLIATRQVAEGDLLPSVREFGDRLGINLNTVRAAYKKLEADGLVTTRRGVGTTVLAFDPRKFSANASRVRTFTVGVVIPDFASYVFPAFLEGVDETAQWASTSVLISTSGNSDARAVEAIHQLIAKGVDGIIVASTGHLEGEKSSVPAGGRLPPIVYVDQPDLHGNLVLLDSEGAGYQATKHLLSHGFTRVGLITCPLTWANVHECYAGYGRALEESGLELEQEIIVTAPDFSIGAGHAAARQLLEVDDPPAAIFAVADTLAIGALRAAKELKRRVPEEVAVVGFTDIELAGIAEPPLTTVHAPLKKLGVEAMTMLLDAIEGDGPLERKVTLETSLVIRRSCGDHNR